MAFKKISDLNPNLTPSGSGIIPISQDGQTFGSTLDTIKGQIEGNLTGSFSSTSSVDDLTLTVNQVTTSIDELNVFTSSAGGRLDSLETFTGSLDDSFATDSELQDFREYFNTYTSSNNNVNIGQNNRLDILESSLSGQTTDGRLDSIESKSGSWITLNDLPTPQPTPVPVDLSPITGRLDALEIASGSIRNDFNLFTSSYLEASQSFDQRITNLLEIINGCCVTPTPTATEVPQPTPTSTVEPTPTATEVPQPTPTNTPVPTSSSTPVPTSTVEPTPTNTPVPTSSSTPVPTSTVEPTPTPTVDEEPTPTNTPAPTATEVPPTPTPTTDYTLFEYMIVWRRNTLANGMTYDFTRLDGNGDYFYSNEQIKCIYETYGTGGGNFWNIAVGDNSEGLISVGDDSWNRVSLGNPTNIVGSFNSTTRAVWYDNTDRLGNGVQHYIITFVSGEVTDLVSFDSIGDVSGCTPYVDPTPTPTSTVEPTPTPTVDEGPVPTSTVEPTPTDTPVPTSTVEPTPTSTVEPTPTATVEPTGTPAPNPTPTPTVNLQDISLVFQINNDGGVDPWLSGSSTYNDVQNHLCAYGANNWNSNTRQTTGNPNNPQTGDRFYAGGFPIEPAQNILYKYNNGTSVSDWRWIEVDGSGYITVSGFTCSTPTPTPTVEPTSTPDPTPTSTPEPTSTETPTPTATVEPTPTPTVSLTCLDGDNNNTVNYAEIQFGAGNYYIFNGNYETYHTNTGTYLLKNVSSGHPITVLNYGKESLIYVNGTHAGTKLGSDGNSYSYYYGDVTITVQGNYGTVSYECYYHGYMGGQDNLVFSNTCPISPTPTPTSTVEPTATPVPPTSTPAPTPTATSDPSIQVFRAINANHQVTGINTSLTGSNFYGLSAQEFYCEMQSYEQPGMWATFYSGDGTWELNTQLYNYQNGGMGSASTFTGTYMFRTNYNNGALEYWVVTVTNGVVSFIQQVYYDGSGDLISTGIGQLTACPTPTPTPTPSATETINPTPTPTVPPSQTPQPTPTSTVELTPTPSSTVEPTPTNTPVPTSSSTPVPTSTVEPTPTPTEEPNPTPTSTDVPQPTPTPTSTVEPTATPVPPSPTPTSTQVAVGPTPTPTVDPANTIFVYYP